MSALPEDDLESRWERGTAADLKRTRPPSSVLSIRLKPDVFEALTTSARKRSKTANALAAEMIEKELVSGVIQARLPQLLEISKLLDASLTPRGIAQWFRASNRLLGGARPMDVLGEGRVAAVRKAAEAFVAGDYA